MAITRASCVYLARFSTTAGLVCEGILQRGTDEQRKKYLTRLGTGEITGAFRLTEEDAGYLATHDVERLYRNVRLLRIFEGTSQIQQTIIARHLIKEEANYC